MAEGEKIDRGKLAGFKSLLCCEGKVGCTRSSPLFCGGGGGRDGLAVLGTRLLCWFMIGDETVAEVGYKFGVTGEVWGAATVLTRLC